MFGSSRFRCMDEHLLIHTQLHCDSQSLYSLLGWYVLIDYVTRTRKATSLGALNVTDCDCDYLYDLQQ